MKLKLIFTIDQFVVFKCILLFSNVFIYFRSLFDFSLDTFTHLPDHSSLNRPKNIQAKIKIFYIKLHAKNYQSFAITSTRVHWLMIKQSKMAQATAKDPEMVLTSTKWNRNQTKVYITVTKMYESRSAIHAKAKVSQWANKSEQIMIFQRRREQERDKLTPWQLSLFQSTAMATHLDCFNVLLIEKNKHKSNALRMRRSLDWVYKVSLSISCVRFAFRSLLLCAMLLNEWISTPMKKYKNKNSIAWIR